MRIAPVNYSQQVQNNNRYHVVFKPSITPSFGYGFDDASFLDEPYEGYSILDLIKWFRRGKPPKPTQEQIDKVLETWDPDLGDISDITDPGRNNFGPLEDALEELHSGKQDNEPVKKEPEEEPPSIFIYSEDEI